MNVLIVGSGGREHALAWKISLSNKSPKIYVAPGNAGTASVADNVDLKVNDFNGIANFCRDQAVDLVVVGPEIPLVGGIRNHLQQALPKLLIVGPDQEGARLEGSKAWAKDFMERYHIPAAASKSFHSRELQEANTFLEGLKPPFVIKADGLAAGKGVLILENIEAARDALEDMLLNKKFGQASNTVVIEEFLEGVELSVFILTDGKSYVLLPEAKDYKRIGEKDTGPNTGGMGAVSPVPFADQDFMQKVENEVIKPTISGLQKEKIEYNGFIFFGLINCKGQPKVIEYNVRMGDPEAQVVLPRIESDLLDLLLATARKELAQTDLKVTKDAATTVVMVSGGYPDQYRKGLAIEGLGQNFESLVFHAGTKFDTSGRVVTDGGRVLALTGLGTDQKQALEKSYRSALKVCWDEVYYRKDIGNDIL